MVGALPLRFWSAWRLVALLGFALLAPAALPAGGGERRLPEVRRRESQREPLVSEASLSLHSAPQRQAPVLISLEAGVPLRVLRQWLAPNGSRWLQVEARSPQQGSTRGWLAG